MKNGLICCVVITTLFSATSLSGQNTFRIGPSALLNASFFDDKVYTAFGGEVAYEFGILSRISINVAGTIHYGTHPNTIDPTFTEKDLLIGIQPEFRFHFQERSNGLYLGIGGDVRHLRAVNFTPPVSDDPKPTLSDWELDFGVSFGAILPISFGNTINPFVYIGYNPFDGSEYDLHSRLGVTLGF